MANKHTCLCNSCLGESYISQSDLNIVCSCRLQAFVTLFSLIRPSVTPKYGILAFYVLDLLAAFVSILTINDSSLSKLLGPALQLIISLLLISLTGSLPVSAQYPSENVGKRSDSPTRALDSPEDGVTLFSWLLVDWMNPLLNTAKQRTIEDTDIWQLSPFFRHYIIYPVFKALPQKNLFGKIYAFTAYDLAICAVCSTMIAVLNFAQPFFLKLILEALSSDSPELKTRAYHLALLAFAFSLIRAELELFRTWHSRRGYERVRGALITMVFDKATKRKDTSGSLGHRKLDKDEQDVQGADAGRVLNMMNGDAYAVAQWIWEVCDLPLQVSTSSKFLFVVDIQPREGSDRTRGSYHIPLSVSQASQEVFLLKGKH